MTGGINVLLIAAVSIKRARFYSQDF